MNEQQLHSTHESQLQSFMTSSWQRLTGKRIQNQNDVHSDGMDDDDFDRMSSSSGRSGKRVRSQSGPEMIRSLPSVPPTPEFVDPKMTDTLLAQHMNSLSMEEREKVLDEVNGIVTDNKMGAGMRTTANGEGGRSRGSVYQSLLQLQHEISAVPKKHAYDIAYSMSKEYVTNPRFMNFFLMADNYNVKHAAVRLVAYFEQKLELFGADKLVKDITQDDLSEDELEMLYDGQENQLCSVRDSAGRAIIFGRCAFGETITKLRFNWYFFDSMIFRDTAASQKGVVVVAYTINNDVDGTRAKKIHHDSPDRTQTWKIFKLIQCLPIKFASMHFCVESNNPIQRSLLNMCISMLEGRTMIRARVHDGSHIEVLHKLMSYGIPPDAIPIHVDGTEKYPPLGHAHFFQELLQREQIEKREHEAKLERMLEREQQQLQQELQEHQARQQVPIAGDCNNNEGVEQGLDELLRVFDDDNNNKVQTNVIFDDIELPSDVTALPHAAMTAISTPAPIDTPGAAGASEMPRVEDMGGSNNIRIGSNGSIFATDSKDNNDHTNEKIHPTASAESTTTTFTSTDYTHKVEGLLKGEQEVGGPKRFAIPGPHDILLGKGKAIGDHKGNVYFRQIIESHASQYNESNKTQKTRLAQTLVDQIRSSGVRFLKRDDSKPTTNNDDGGVGGGDSNAGMGPNSSTAGWWIEVSNDVARTKVSHTFRNHRLLKGGSKKVPSKNKASSITMVKMQDDDRTCFQGCLPMLA